jgi:hypothetical protein
VPLTSSHPQYAEPEPVSVQNGYGHSSPQAPVSEGYGAPSTYANGHDSYAPPSTSKYPSISAPYSAPPAQYPYGESEFPSVSVSDPYSAPYSTPYSAPPPRETRSVEPTDVSAGFLEDPYPAPFIKSEPDLGNDYLSAQPASLPPAPPSHGSYDNNLQFTDPYADVQDPYAPTAKSEYPNVSVSYSAHPGDLDSALRPPYPIATFAFGGKLVTSFPTSSSSRGMSPYGGAFGGPSSPIVTIHRIADLVPDTRLKSFPGPLFCDGSGKAGAAKKRKEVTTWLSDWIDELYKGKGYRKATGADGEARETEDRAVLIGIVKALVENDGKMSGS